jgi:hypothetical protein
MPGPLGYAAIGLGAQALGGLLGGGGQPEMPGWMKNLYMQELRRNRAGAFSVDRAGFDRRTQLAQEDIFRQYQVSAEGFEADLARRGIRGAGQAPGAKYRDVIAPAVGAAQQAQVAGELGFAQMQQQGQIAASQISASILTSLGGQTPAQYTPWQAFGNVLMQGGDLATSFAVGQMFGLFDGGQAVTPQVAA